MDRNEGNVREERDVAKSMSNEFNLEVGCTYETEADMRRKEEGGTIGNPWSVLLRGFFFSFLLPPGRTKFVRRATVSLQRGMLLLRGRKFPFRRLVVYKLIQVKILFSRV